MGAHGRMEDALLQTERCHISTLDGRRCLGEDGEEADGRGEEKEGGWDGKRTRLHLEERWTLMARVCQEQ